MIRSMTGFGQAVRQAGGIRIQIDMKSVNHRYCEVVFRMPREWLVHEEALRKLIAGKVKRGRVDVFVTVERSGADTNTVDIDWAIADAFVQAAGQLAERYGIVNDLSLEQLLALPGLVQTQDRLPDGEHIGQSLLETASDALDLLRSMREKEGAFLQTDIQERFRILTGLLELTAAAAPEANSYIRNRLLQKLTELSDTMGTFDETRFHMEAALLVERSDINEELTRLRSHLQQWTDLIALNEPIGRKLDFLIQEMNREVNTIGSKAGHTELIKHVVEMKAELEKMREQVQNIE